MNARSFALLLLLLVVVVGGCEGCPLLGLAAASCATDDNCPSGQVCIDGACGVDDGDEGEGEEGEGEDGEGEGEDGEGEGEEGEGEEGEGEFTGAAVRVVGGFGFDTGQDAVVLADGRLFATGQYTPVTATVGTGAEALPLPSDTGDDIAGVIAAFAADGTPLWRRVVGGAVVLSGGAADPIAVDDEADIVYVAGLTSFNGVFGFGDVDVRDAHEAYVVALDAADGSVVWLRELPGGVDSMSEVVVVGDKVVAVGTIEGADVDFDGVVLSSFGAAGEDIFALGLDAADGDVVWGRVFGGGSADFQPSATGAGSDVVVGFGAESFVHDGESATALTAATGIVFRFSVADGTETGRYVDDGGDGNLELGALVGFVDGSAWVCGRNDPRAVANGFFLLRLDASLTLETRQRFDGEHCGGLASDGAGGVIAANFGARSTVVVHFDDAGAPVSDITIDADNGFPRSLRAAGGHVAVTGDYRDAFDLDDAHYAPVGASDAMFLLLDFAPAP